MAPRSNDYLARASEYPRRAWDKGEAWASRMPEPVRRPSTTMLVGLAALAVCVAAGLYFSADLARYMKMRQM